MGVIDVSEHAKSSGSSTAMNTIAPEQFKTILQIAKRTKNLKKEQYRIVGENGDILLQKQGKEHEVLATVGEKRELMRGSVSIHNHPNGGTFSSPDLRDFGYGAKQIAVSSPEGVYRLTAGKKSDWYGMQQAMDKAGVTKELSYIDLKKTAEQKPQIKKLTNQISNLSQQWVEARKQGQPQKALDDIAARVNTLREKHKAAISKEIRKSETKPYDDFYKKNAKKYGFEYTFTKW